jgi:hypothetical protein
MPVAIRLIGPEDAAPLLSLQHRLDSQSRFMLLEPDERPRAPDRVRERLAEPGLNFDLLAAAGEEASGEAAAA